MADPRYLSARAIESVADLAALVEEFCEAMRGLTRDPIEAPPRQLVIHENPFSAFGTMSAVSRKHDLFMTKVAALVTGAERGKSVHSQVTAMSARTGEPIAVLEGSSITNLKCAALTALVTDRCVRPEVKRFALIGTGVQARQQMRGVLAVRKPEELRLFSQTPAHAEEFAREFGDKFSRVTVCASADEAVRGAELISTTTTSTQPLFSMAVTGTGPIHVNCMGAHTESSREVPQALLETATLIVEDIDTAVREAGPVHGRALSVETLVTARGSLAAERTVFSSTGHAVFDLLTTAHVLRRLTRSV